MPRAAQLWYKYVYMEEVLGNPAGARQVFERWMNWMPEPQAWHTYINFEIRHQEADRARAIYERCALLALDCFEACQIHSQSTLSVSLYPN